MGSLQGLEGAAAAVYYRQFGAMLTAVGFPGRKKRPSTDPAIEERARLEEAAAGVPLLRDETRWLEVRDYSARAGSELLLGGKVGRVRYGPGAVRFLPLLRAGEIVQLGKNVTSGCGRIEVRPATGEW